jgi:hypothetical protein
MNQILSSFANFKLNAADWFDRWRPREWMPRLKYWRWDRRMGTRKSEEEMWEWADTSRKGVWEKRIRVFSRPRNWPQMLVFLEIAESNSDAQRLIKAGSIQIQDWIASEDWTAIDLNTPLPESPTHIRRGKKFYGIKTVWLPPAKVSQWQAEDMMRKFT